MGKLIVVLGGAASGKSAFALRLARSSKKVAYLATAMRSPDPEMERKIKEHQKARPSHWLTVEEPQEVAKLLGNLKKKVKVVIIDCLTLLLTNWLLKGGEDGDLIGKIKNLIRIAKRTKLTVIMVSHEVGMGIVPENRLARLFRDRAGRANQILAETADEVYLMMAGIPLKIKGGFSDGKT